MQQRETLTKAAGIKHVVLSPALCAGTIAGRAAPGKSILCEFRRPTERGHLARLERENARKAPVTHGVPRSDSWSSGSYGLDWQDAGAPRFNYGPFLRRQYISRVIDTERKLEGFL